MPSRSACSQMVRWVLRASSAASRPSSALCALASDSDRIVCAVASSGSAVGSDAARAWNSCVARNAYSAAPCVSPTTSRAVARFSKETATSRWCGSPRRACSATRMSAASCSSPTAVFWCTGNARSESPAWLSIAANARSPTSPAARSSRWTRTCSSRSDAAWSASRDSSVRAAVSSAAASVTRAERGSEAVLPNRRCSASAACAHSWATSERGPAAT
mmetsp:Transcript_28433/g.88135  ORF Transcript_28433/g.88135 Transcript_28433/m.88135 type:complete len:218 (-) Transcript_28433:1332-1985(-)